ncbi:MAG: ABC transporter ATP-binding protein [Spirochaetota bacterium]
MEEDITLEVQNLSIEFDTEEGLVEAVKGLSYSVRKGETLCIVGESGCGKSVSSYGVMRLIPTPPGRICGGSAYLRTKDGRIENVLAISEKRLCKLRGKEMSMIFQEPMTALNPVASVGAQVDESLRLHTTLRKKERYQRAADLLREVGLVEGCYSRYPHELSGGQRQRVLIAIALACEPSLLIADEPTTALDVTVQAQILDLLQELQSRHKMSIVLITHDLAVVAEVAHSVVVMYAGSIVESGSVEQIFSAPQHPYTQALLDSLPSLGENEKVLKAIEGRVPKLIGLGEGCRFANRCAYVQERCRRETPQLESLEQSQKYGHMVRCFFPLSKKEGRGLHG